MFNVFKYIKICLKASYLEHIGAISKIDADKLVIAYLKDK